MMGWIDTKRPPTFSVDGLDNDMDFHALRREWSTSADCFRCKVRWDSCYSSARGAAPCTERSDAKQPGHLAVRAVCLAERTYSRHESIEVRPCYQGIFHHSHSSAAYSFANSSGQRTSQRVCSASKVRVPSKYYPSSSSACSRRHVTLASLK